MTASERAPAQGGDAVALLEADVDETIALCGGDVRAALRAMLVVNAYLEVELAHATGAVSAGFARSRRHEPV
jgi:hypothetical protein